MGTRKEEIMRIILKGQKDPLELGVGSFLYLRYKITGETKGVHTLLMSLDSKGDLYLEPPVVAVNLDDVKETVVGFSKPQRDNLYKFLHDALGCRLEWI